MMHVMKGLNIRDRLLLAALLPVVLVSATLVSITLYDRVSAMEVEHQRQLRLAARQLAAAASHGLSTARRDLLMAAAIDAIGQDDLSAVAVLDLNGELLAVAGELSVPVQPFAPGREGRLADRRAQADVLVQPVWSDRRSPTGEIETIPNRVGRAPVLLGHVVLDFPRAAAVQRRTDAVLADVAVGLAGLLVGALLALWLARGIVVPLLRMSRMVARIQLGDLSARSPELASGPLGTLQHGLNQMVRSLESGRDELQQRVAEATQRLREQMDQAEQATLAKSRFLAAATHDLRQPTHALGLFVERLRQLPHEGESGQLISNLEASVRSMQDLLDALLDISRLNANAVPAEIRPFALNDLFDKLRISAGPGARAKGLRLRIRPTQVWLLSDAGQLHRILQNLVANAMAYTPRGTVLLSCRPVRGGGMARIQVWDSGVGIAPEHHEAVFKDYFQVANPARDNSKGLGLGLHIVDLIANLLGLSVQLRSNLGCGSRFTMDVPLALTSPDQPDLVDSIAADPSLLSISPLPKHRMVLVLEDDRLSREAVGSLLLSWGFSVRTADTLAVALQQIEDEGPPDLVVSDYRLAEWVNGIDAVLQLRAAANRPIPACLMSGTSTPALVQAAREVGLTLLQKPVRPAKLRSLLRRLLATPGQDQGSGEDEDAV
jgi:signal transduction histidine kinase/CheY-like chemotaxis protein